MEQTPTHIHEVTNLLQAGGFIERLREEAIEMKNNLLIQLGKTTQQEEMSHLLKSIVTYQVLGCTHIQKCL